MKRTIHTVVAAIASACLSMPVQAETILVSDTFPTDGPLVGMTPSPGPGATWEAHSGAGNLPLQVSGGQVVVTHGGGSREDANSAFRPKFAGVVTYSMDVSVDDLGSPIGGTDFEYFVSFGATGGASTLLGRVDVVAPTGIGDYTLGIATSGGSSDATWGSDFSYGEQVSIAVSYNLANNQASLSVNGGSPIFGAINGADTTLIDDISIRQSDSSNDETVRIDNLQVTYIPEPHSLILALFAMSGAIVGLRRRWG